MTINFTKKSTVLASSVTVNNNNASIIKVKYKIYKKYLEDVIEMGRKGKRRRRRLVQNKNDGTKKQVLSAHDASSLTGDLHECNANITQMSRRTETWVEAIEKGIE